MCEESEMASFQSIGGIAPLLHRNVVVMSIVRSFIVHLE